MECENSNAKWGIPWGVCRLYRQMWKIEVVNSSGSVQIVPRNVDDPITIPHMHGVEVVNSLRSVQIVPPNVDDPYAIPHIGGGNGHEPPAIPPIEITTPVNLHIPLLLL